MSDQSNRRLGTDIGKIRCIWLLAPRPVIVLPYGHVSPHIFNRFKTGVRIPVIDWLNIGRNAHRITDSFGSRLRFWVNVIKTAGMGNTQLSKNMNVSNIYCSDIPRKSGRNNVSFWWYNVPYQAFTLRCQQVRIRKSNQEIKLEWTINTFRKTRFLSHKTFFEEGFEKTPFYNAMKSWSAKV